MRGAAMLALVLATACHTSPRPELPIASAWPAADALFRRDPRWRGGDAAYSVDLGAGRTLWLFGDSFVARPGSVGRRGCAMVRNSIAVQTGADPSRAAIEFHWRGTADQPGSWFAEDGEVWHWPLGGVCTGDAVTLFCTRVRGTGEAGPFGFRAVGWTAFVLRGIDGPVQRWTCERLATFAAGFPVVVGTAVIAGREWVHAYALAEPGDHAVHLLRWPRAAFLAGDLLGPQWFDQGAWRIQPLLAPPPTPVLASGAPEFSVHRDRRGFWMVQSLGFGGTDLAVRRAPAPEGPWSEPQVVFRPQESDLEGVFVYAGKAHPQLEGGDLVLTYATNAWDFARAVADESLYFPRFVRLQF
jgi:hypothetical protein